MNEVNTNDVTTRYRAFAVRYRGPTERGASRILIRDLRHGTRKSLPYDDEESGQSYDRAASYLARIGIKVDALMLSDFGPLAEVALLTTDFSTPLK